MTALTSSDPEPPVGTLVQEQVYGDTWERVFEDRKGWVNRSADDDVESWTRIAGNYGPVLVVGSPEGTKH